MNSDTGARQPATALAGFSSENAVATTWASGRLVLEGAEVYWVASVRPDGRPHVTPLLGIWLDGAMYFCTGEGERKAKNLESNPHCDLIRAPALPHAVECYLSDGDFVSDRLHPNS